MADERLDDETGERGGEPQDGDLVGARAKILVNGAHVRHLQVPAELDSEEAEAHVPDLGRNGNEVSRASPLGHHASAIVSTSPASLGGWQGLGVSCPFTQLATPVAPRAGPVC